MFDLHRPKHQTLRWIGLTLTLIGLASWMALPESVLGRGALWAPASLFGRAEPPPTAPPAQSTLTLEDRVAYQRAIEEVYWRHRIWPKENRQAKPNLDEVMPLSAIRAKVEDYLSKSRALEAYWQRPITGAQLQAEMERMARQTKQPAVLKELWAALGNDPYVIAECLARPSLANRLIKNWYAHDERYHGELKRRAEADLRAYGTASQMRQMSGEYREVQWANTPHPQRLSLWERVARYSSLMPSPLGRGWSHEAGTGEGAGPADMRSELDLLPLGELSRLQDDDERFYISAVLEKGHEQLKVATVEWRKQPFDVWWKGQEQGTVGVLLAAPTIVRFDEQVRREIDQPHYAYRLAATRSGPSACVDDTWAPIGPPSARYWHTAVWTASEMIVWGGFDGTSFEVNTGGRYDPASDSWTTTSTINAPSARYLHTAVWTGSEMIVWGGSGASGLVDTGGRYCASR